LKYKEKPQKAKKIKIHKNQKIKKIKKCKIKNPYKIRKKTNTEQIFRKISKYVLTRG